MGRTWQPGVLQPECGRGAARGRAEVVSYTLCNRRSSGGLVVEAAPTPAEARFELIELEMPVVRAQRGSGRGDHDSLQLEPLEVGEVVGQDLVNALLASAPGVGGRRRPRRLPRPSAATCRRTER